MKGLDWIKGAKSFYNYDAPKAKNWSQQLGHPTICKGGAVVVIERGKGRF